MFTPIGEVIENVDGKAKIRIYQEYAKGLKGLEEYSHCIVLYVFHKLHIGREEILERISSVTPMPAPDNVVVGVFATRSPLRPNPIGLTVVRLLKIEHDILFVDGFDGLPGSPILDIKPYTPGDICIDIVLPGWFPREGYINKIKKFLHNSIDKIWRLSKEIRKLFIEANIDVSEISMSFNNYIKISDEYVHQHYPLPFFVVDSKCELLLQIDYIVLTTAIYKRTITSKLLSDLVRRFNAKVEIYGGTNFLKTFYPSDTGLAVDKIFGEIMDSDEETIQISIIIPFKDYLSSVRIYKDLINIIMRNRAEIVSYPSSHIL